MALYNLYAGMGGGFGGCSYHCTEEYDTHEEALDAAMELAREEYQSYEGSHGILSWYDVAREVLAENGVIESADDFDGNNEDIDNMLDDELRELVHDAYNEEIEGWIDYKAVLASDDTEVEDYA